MNRDSSSAGGPSLLPSRPVTTTAGKNLSFASTPSTPPTKHPGKNLSRGGKPRSMCMAAAPAAAAKKPAAAVPTGGKNLSFASGGKPATIGGGKNMSLMAKRRRPIKCPDPPSSRPAATNTAPPTKPAPRPPASITLPPPATPPPKPPTTTPQKPTFKTQLASMQSALNAVQSQMQEIKNLYSSSQVSQNGLKLKIRRGGEQRQGGRRGAAGSGLTLNQKQGAAAGSGGGAGRKGSDSGWGSLLPESVLLQVFRYLVEVEDGCLPALVRASKVCRLWRSVATRPELWTNVDLRKVVDIFRLERNLLFLLENRFARVRHLNLGGWALTPSMVSALVTIAGRTLRTLQVPGCEKLTAQQLQELSEGCTELRRLDLSGVSPWLGKVQLAVVKMAKLLNFYDKSAKIKEFYHLSNSQLHLSESGLQLQTAYNTKSAVTPSALHETFTRMAARLVHLSIADNCLANCQQIVQSLAEHCPNLQVLDLSNVSSPRRDSIQIRVEQLQLGCPNLRVLRLTNTDIGLSSRAMEGGSGGFPKLEELSIAVDPRRCQGLDDNDLERIVKGAQGLKLFDVRGCGRISDSAIVRVPAYDLQHLFLSGCSATKSSPDGLELIVRKWRHSFVELDLSWTPSEQTIALALAALAETDCPTLRVLNICGSSVTLPTLKSVLGSCPRLESLNLTSCRALPRGLKRNYGVVGEVRELRRVVGGMGEEGE